MQSISLPIFFLLFVHFSTVLFHGSSVALPICYVFFSIWWLDFIYFPNIYIFFIFLFFFLYSYIVAISISSMWNNPICYHLILCLLFQMIISAIIVIMMRIHLFICIIKYHQYVYIIWLRPIITIIIIIKIRIVITQNHDFPPNNYHRHNKCNYQNNRDNYYHFPTSEHHIHHWYLKWVSSPRVSQSPESFHCMTETHYQKENWISD